MLHKYNTDAVTHLSRSRYRAGYLMVGRGARNIDLIYCFDRFSAPTASDLSPCTWYPSGAGPSRWERYENNCNSPRTQAEGTCYIRFRLRSGHLHLGRYAFEPYTLTLTRSECQRDNSDRTRTRSSLWKRHACATKTTDERSNGTD